jgi:hypothetical protein
MGEVMSWGKIVSPGLPDYQLTDEDVLVAAAAADGESGNPLYTLWAWTQRFALPARRRVHGTFKALLYAHSQPINPIWRRDGAKCRPGGTHHNTDACAAHKLARRDNYARIIAARDWSAIEPQVVEATQAWACGRTQNPVPGAIDFAVSSVSRSTMSRYPDLQHSHTDRNVWFLSDSTSRTWAPGAVRITPCSGARIGARGALSRSGGSAWGTTLALALGAAVVGVLFARRS